MQRLKTLFPPVIIAFLIGVCGITFGAAIGVSWSKSEVVPVILVKPGIDGFEPAEGSSIGNTWRKSEVKPVILVKPGIVGFEPREGTSIGNVWRRDELLPVLLLEPSAAGFVPLRVLASGADSVGSPTMPAPAEQRGFLTPSVIESRIDGESNGWEGETMVKLTNGQIWQQSAYYYRYRYAYMPKVLIFKSGGEYSMKIEGIEKAVRVTRLK